MPAPALPFWMALSLLPMIALSAAFGGWWLLLVTVYTTGIITVLDQVLEQDTANADPQTQSKHLFWHSLVTWVWPPLQIILIFAGIAWITHGGVLKTWEGFALMAVIGVATGAVGINFAHELIHQKNIWERRGGELLLISTLYGHFKSEHLLVHHRYVATPRDPVTARYNEGFHRFIARVLPGCFTSAWDAEIAMLARKGLPAWSSQNPFWRYIIGAILFLALAALIGGWLGLALFLTQAAMAVLYLELTNYIEHYGLTREHLGDGKYEHVKPHHSWNANHRVSNWFLINLQRHSDHHFKPDRRFPLLQSYGPEAAPQLPYSYPIMTLCAMIPPLFRRVMNPRVRAWRTRFYPHIDDWAAYKTASNPHPR